jgi:hypothetical protein
MQAAALSQDTIGIVKSAWAKCVEWFNWWADTRPRRELMR